MWPWQLKHCPYQFSACNTASLLNIDIVTHCHIRLCNMASFNIIDLDYEPVFLTSEVACYFSACIKVGLLKPHHHTWLCNMACLSILTLWLDSVTLILERLSMPILMVWGTILWFHQVALSVAGSAFCDCQVDFGPPSLKYSNTLCVKFGVSTSEIIIDRCVFKSLFTSVHLQSISLKPLRSTILYFVLHIVIERLIRFVYLRTREGNLLMDHGTSFYLFQAQNILYYCLGCIYTCLWYYK